MGVIEEQFQQLIDMTEQLYRVLGTHLQNDDFPQVDQLFASRESLLIRLRESLQTIADIEKYQRFYDSWQVKETELLDFVKSSLQDLDKKITDIHNSRIFSNGYDSYLQQVPYGSFVDKKK